ncbi:latexin [Carassius carassius]|uniref:latexin n=1 Tax=Carassius carassius TaxID=217509 RepID=UPI00286970A5|nr:latexin [Carassius carassius]
MKTFCSVWLLLSLVELSPAPPVSQEPPLACTGAPGHAPQSETAEDMASTGDLEPTHYPARRAATVALHYLNTHHGSPFRVFGLQQVHKASAEDVAAGGRKYKLDFSVTDWASGSEGPALRCSADVLFPQAERHSGPEVQLHCEALQQLNRTAQEEHAFYQRYISPESAISARDIPDSYGNVSEEMQPFWRLARVAASFIMLRESSENTEFNMAQVASVTQQGSREEQLMLEFVVLLHDFPSQEIIQWKLLASWSPDRGVRVLQTEWQPRCPHATKPPN